MSKNNGPVLEDVTEETAISAAITEGGSATVIDNNTAQAKK